MRRRDFIKAVGGISVGWLPPAYAQRTNKTPRVGVLWHAGSAEEETIGLGALTRAFSDLGYVDGKNIALHLSCCRFDGRLVKLIPPYVRTQRG
jgi:putative ABC transport system substrate-binding protein